MSGDAHEFTQRVRVVSIDPDGNQLSTPQTPLPHHQFGIISEDAAATAFIVSNYTEADWGVGLTFYPYYVNIWLDHATKRFVYNDDILRFRLYSVLAPHYQDIEEFEIQSKDINMYLHAGNYSFSYMKFFPLARVLPTYSLRMTFNMYPQATMWVDDMTVTIGGYLVDE